MFLESNCVHTSYAICKNCFELEEIYGVNTFIQKENNYKKETFLAQPIFKFIINILRNTDIFFPLIFNDDSEQM